MATQPYVELRDTLAEAGNPLLSFAFAQATAATTLSLVRTGAPFSNGEYNLNEDLSPTLISEEPLPPAVFYIGLK